MNSRDQRKDLPGVGGRKEGNSKDEEQDGPKNAPGCRQDQRLRIGWDGKQRCSAVFTKLI